VPQLPGGKNGVPLMVFGENDAQVGSNTKKGSSSRFRAVVAMHTNTVGGAT
jgi:hypothetical protein